MNHDDLKKKAAFAALAFVEIDAIVGVGTGSTVAHFIQALATIKHKISGAVASSHQTAEKLKALSIPLYDLNAAPSLSLYVDGADEINSQKQMIKGGGGAHVREKIIASVADKFICIADDSKYVNALGQFPIACEVVPMARSYVAREIVKLGGGPVYRQGFVTDNGNLILDIYHMSLSDPLQLETKLNNIAGVVGHGIFAQRCADILLLAKNDKVWTY